MMKRKACEESWDQLVEWIRERCRQRSQPDPDYWLEPVKNLLMKALLGSDSLLLNDGTGGKYFPLLPDKVSDRILSFLTDPEDLLNLRLVSKCTQEWVDSYSGLEFALNSNPVRFHQISDVARFLVDNKGLPVTFFIFNLETESFFYEAPVISAFLRRFGCKVRRIVLPCLYQMEHESEFEFYESLTNLRELYLSCTLPLFAANTTELIKFPVSITLIEKFEKCCGMIPPDKNKPLRTPSFCANLRILQIHHAIKNDYPFQLISKCVNLQYLKIPRFSCPDMILSICEMGEESHLIVNKCACLYDLLKSNKHLAKIDFQDSLFLDEMSETEELENKEYLFYEMIRNRGTILKSVSVTVLNYLDERYGREIVEDLAMNILSIEGFDQIVCDVDFPKLQIIRSLQSSAFIGDVDLRRVGKFPQLDLISVECSDSWMDSVRGGGRRKAERFFCRLLKVAATSKRERVRVDVGMGKSIYSAMLVPRHRTLFINLIMSTFYNTPYNLSRLVTTPFKHLERLIVVFNPMDKKTFDRFLAVVVENFAGTLRSLDFETNGHMEDKWLAPITGLKKLFVLKFKFGNDTCVISDRLFRNILRNLPLEALELEGVGFSRVTPIALRWLTTKVFCQTIKHFYFDNCEVPGAKLETRIRMAVAGVRTYCEINQIKSGGAPDLTEFLMAIKEPADFTNTRPHRHARNKN